VRTNSGSQYSYNNYKPITNSKVGNASNKPQSRTAGSKYGGSEILDPATSEMQDELADVWKVFGRDTEAGRALWRTYASGHKKQINYPGLKTKPWDPKEALKIEMKPCPQQTVIEYPPVFTKAGITRAKMMSNIHKIDLIQHRKPRDQILVELRKYYSVVEIPVNRAVNREKMIDELQEKFKYSKPSRPGDKAPTQKYIFSSNLAQSWPKKLAQSWPKKLAQSWPKAGPKLAQSWPKAGPKLAQSWPKKRPLKRRKICPKICLKDF
jgi:hypothetical protein